MDRLSAEKLLIARVKSYHPNLDDISYYDIPSIQSITDAFNQSHGTKLALRFQIHIDDREQNSIGATDVTNDPDTTQKMSQADINDMMSPSVPVAAQVTSLAKRRENVAVVRENPETD